MKSYKACIVVRGEVIEDDLLEFGGRSMGIVFQSPDPRKYVSRLPLGSGRLMGDMYDLKFADVLDYIARLGERLDLERNDYFREALEASEIVSSLTPPLLRAGYQSMRHMFSREFAYENAQETIGADHLDGWVPKVMSDGRRLSIRAFGARAVHVIAGNGPGVAAISILRNLITRGDAIIKSPSNDPFTALAIARTMIDMDPTHPLTRHLSVAYWKGGDEAVEQQLYQPSNIEKIVAWGGFAGVKHVAKYIQPGIQLVTLDPKRSISIIGPEAFNNEESMRDAALRLATDIGAINQEGCVCARTVYALCGTDDESVAKLRTLGRYCYEAMLTLPSHISTPAKAISPDLRAMVNSARLNDEWYTVTGGMDGEGAIIVSHLPEAVEFAPYLASRIANLIPVEHIDQVCEVIDAYTQTLGIYPDSLMHKLRDRLTHYGAQRFVSLGYAAHVTLAAPQDAIESTRQLCKWVISEECDPAVTTPLWDEAGEQFGLNKPALKHYSRVGTLTMAD